MAISILLLCLQACLFQIVLTQCPGYGPSLGSGLGAGQIGNGMALGPNPALGSLAGPLGYNNLGPAAPYHGYSNPGFGTGPNSPYPGYGGSGSGDVAVAGELPVAGSTVVAGQVPVVGGVQFGGSLPAAGIVTITGTCSCGSPYGY